MLFRSRLNGVSLVPLPDPDRPVFAQRFPNSPEARRYSDFVVQGRAALHLDYTTGVEELYLDYYTNPEDEIGRASCRERV